MFQNNKNIDYIKIKSNIRAKAKCDQKQNLKKSINELVYLFIYFFTRWL